MSNPRFSPSPDPYATPRRRGFIRGVLGWISGLIRYVLATVLFFALMAWGSYVLVSNLIRGDELKAPDLRGKPLSEAMKWLGEDKDLRKYNLTVKWEREQSSDSVESGNIISQYPEPGDSIKKGTAIRVVVSGGIALVSVPDLRNVQYYKAQLQLKKLGLEIGNRTMLPSREAVGTVLATDPPSGTGVPQGARINLMVATGETAVTQSMPDLKGMKLDQARDVLTKAGLFATEVKVSRSDAPAGQVISQTPSAGEAVTDSTKIVLKYTPTREEGGYEPPTATAGQGAGAGAPVDTNNIPEVILPETDATPTPALPPESEATENRSNEEGTRPADLEGKPARQEEGRAAPPETDRPELNQDEGKSAPPPETDRSVPSQEEDKAAPPPETDRSVPSQGDGQSAPKLQEFGGTN